MEHIDQFDEFCCIKSTLLARGRTWHMYVIHNFSDISKTRSVQLKACLSKFYKKKTQRKHSLIKFV